jgi:hypothetical protein
LTSKETRQRHRRWDQRRYGWSAGSASGIAWCYKLRRAVGLILSYTVVCWNSLTPDILSNWMIFILMFYYCLYRCRTSC